MPSGATANAATAPVWPVRVWRACPVCGSQIRTVAVVAGGGQPGAVRGDRQRRHPAGVAGEGVAGLPGVRVPDPHRRRRRPAEASQLPSGATANAATPPVWPVRTRSSASCGRSGSGARPRRCGPSMVARICSRSSSRPVWSGSREANVAASDPGGSSGPSRCAFCRTTVASARARGRSDSRRSDSSPAGPTRSSLSTSHRGSASTASSSSRRPAPHRCVANHDHRYASLGGQVGPPTAGGQQVAVGVDHGRVPLGPPLPGGLPQVGADHVVQDEPVGVAPVAGEQPEVEQPPTQPAGLKPGPAAGVRPQPGHHLAGDRDVLAEHRQLPVPGLLVRGQPAQADLDRRRHRRAALTRVGGVQGGDPLDPQRRQHLRAARRPGRRRRATASRTAPCTSDSNTGHRPVARSASATSAGGSAGSPAVSSSWASPSVI